MGQMIRAYEADLAQELADLFSELNPFDEETTKKHIQANEENRKEIGFICGAIRADLIELDKYKKAVGEWKKRLAGREHMIAHESWREGLAVLSEVRDFGEEER